ncbi:hypothetical protein BCR36DRAFT_351154 [Piromyces finnis]|nr:hypothetical protein BCR36DRAFT_351154 [Piromyces finnis]|eukprot:ORX51413.1 hypothetical protein BCR36DRAFT_351154 [Piromyces finnis]
MKYPKLEDNKEIIQFVENARKLKANWVKLLSNNNEQHKEIQVNPNNHVKKNKFQSIMKSTDKRISWSGHDPLKFSKGSNKIYTLPSANNINEESKDHIYPKTSLHEKQLEEENNQLKLKVEDLELIIKNANNQINKCMKLMNEIKSNHLNDDEKVIDEHFNHDYNQLMLDMDILKRILGHKSQNHSLKKTLTPISTKANSKATEKHNIIEESSSMPNSLNSETPSTISISNSSTKPYYEKNIKHKDTINNSLPDSIQNKKSETSIHVSVNVKNSDLAKQSLNKFEEDKITSSQHKKEDDKDNNKNSLNPSSSSSLSNLSLSPITTSVVTATAISTMSSPKKDIINNKSNEFLMDSYKDNNNNIWNDSLKTQEYDSFEIKLDQSHRFDDIKLQDSNFGFQSLNSDNELQSTSKNGFNSISLVGNPWEDPWNKNNTAKLSPKISPFSMKIENSNINEQLKNKIISPTSLNFNPFENTINSPNGNNTMTSTNFFNDHNSNIEKNSDTYGKDSSHINSKSPLSSPILNASPVEKPKIETIESPMSASLNKEESSQKKSFIASSYNSSNSLFSTLTSSIKNNDLDKRIQENKKILFSHDDDKDQNKENSHLAFHSNIHQNKFNNTNTSHGLFNDDQDSEDIFEFIKHSKTKNTSQTTISFPNSYYKASDSNPSSNNTTPLTSPKPIHSNIKTNLSFKSSTFISNHRKSSTSSHFDYKAKKSSNMEYVEYDPLLSPNLKTEEPYRSNKDSFESIPIPTTNNEENFTNPIAPFITPTLGLSTTTTITNVSTNSSQKTRASTSTFYRITEEKHKSKKNDDLGVPVVIENIQSTTIDSLDTNKNAKPVLLDPLGAGVVHSLEF